MVVIVWTGWKGWTGWPGWPGQLWTRIYAPCPWLTPETVFLEQKTRHPGPALRRSRILAPKPSFLTLAVWCSSAKTRISRQQSGTMTAFREMTHGDSWGKRQEIALIPASIASQHRFILFAVTWIDDDRASISSSFWHDSSCWQDGNDNLKLTTLSAIKRTFLVVAKFTYHKYNIVKHWINCESNAAQRIQFYGCESSSSGKEMRGVLLNHALSRVSFHSTCECY